MKETGMVKGRWKFYAIGENAALAAMIRGEKVE